jgi:hypothetical protein
LIEVSVESALVVPVLNSVLCHEGVWELEELFHTSLISAVGGG